MVTGDYSPDEPFWSNGGADQDGFIGSSSDGSLSLSSGSVVEIHQITVGQSSGVTGTVIVEGSGSYLDIQQNLYLGYDGTGNLTVQNGGKVTTQANETQLGSNATGSGTALVTGEDSYLSSHDDLLIGYRGTGTLRVEDGGYVLAERHAYVGYYDGSVGSATVTGSGSEFYTPSRMYIGLYGTGTLNVEDGAKVTVGYYVYLGHYGRDADSGRGNGTANITGAGTEFNVAGNLNVGYWGDGELNVESGATVTSSNGYISYRYTDPQQTRGTGIATITGTGSAWNISDSMVVGRAGHGTLNLEDGGVVNSAAGYLGTMDTESLGLGDGTVTVTGSGSQWNNTGGVDGDSNIIAGNLYVGHDSVGTLNIENGGLVTNSDDGFIGYNAGSSGTVVVSGAGSQWTSSGGLFVGVSGTGILAVGNGGLVTVTADDLALGQGLGFGVNSGSDATLRITIGDDGTGNITSGSIDTGGLFFGDGTATLDIEVDDGVSLSYNSAFTLLTYDTWDGNTFSNVGDGGILSSGGYEWRIDYGVSVGDHFGIVATAVPEPATWAMLAGLGALGIALWRHRKNRGVFANAQSAR